MDSARSRYVQGKQDSFGKLQMKESVFKENIVFRRVPPILTESTKPERIKSYRTPHVPHPTIAYSKFIGIITSAPDPPTDPSTRSPIRPEP